PDASLRVYVHHLRKVLGSARIGRRAGGYVLRLEPDELDVDQFRALVAEGRAAASADEPARAADLFGEGLSLWRGSALSGLESVSVLAGAVAGLEELRLQTLEQRVDVGLVLGHYEAVV